MTNLISNRQHNQGLDFQAHTYTNINEKNHPIMCIVKLINFMIPPASLDPQMSLCCFLKILQKVPAVLYYST